MVQHYQSSRTSFTNWKLENYDTVDCPDELHITSNKSIPVFDIYGWSVWIKSRLIKPQSMIVLDGPVLNMVSELRFSGGLKVRLSKADLFGSIWDSQD